MRSFLIVTNSVHNWLSLWVLLFK